METFRILALLCLIFWFSLENTNGQALNKRYNLSNEITTKSLYNWDTSFSQKNGLVLPRMTGLTFNEFIGLTSKSLYATSSDNRVTFNGKLERLTGKSIIDTSKVFYSPLKSTNNPGIYNSPLYRTSATIYNMVVTVLFPYNNRPK